MSAKARKKFPRREVAIRRAEWTVKPPDPKVEDGDEYDRYETDRMQVMELIQAECGADVPHDLRVIETPTETIISYELQRVILAGR
jgi:hypothetical protein